MHEPDPKYGLGLEQTVNRLVDYNYLWPLAFSEEAARIKAALGDQALAVEHYGSTSVPNLRAKPIIDLQIGVADILHGLRFIEPMARLGYDYVWDHGIPEHHIFGKGEARTHMAHVVVHKGQQWLRYLHFRDRLRCEPDLRDAYEALKLHLVVVAETRSAYTAGKTTFVESTCSTG